MEHPVMIDNIKEDKIDIEIKQEEVTFEFIEEESHLFDEIKKETVLYNEIINVDDRLEIDRKENADEIYENKMMEFINVKAEEENDDAR